MKILITGASGQLGTELKSLIESGEAEIGAIPVIYGDAQVTYTTSRDLDITDEAAVKSLVEEMKPDLIINCAAFTNVDRCETEGERAHSINAIGPLNLAKAAKKVGAKIVQVSTDYVFSGKMSGDRVEEDEVGPISVYGRTKLAGELAVLDTMDRCFIVRTAWLYGYVGHNFVKTMLALAGSHEQVTVVDDQIGNPTSANDLAYEILKLALTDDYGVYHITNEGTCSWADFAEAIMDKAQTGCAVKHCTTDEYKQMNPEAADRPAFSSLDNQRLRETIGNEMRPWQEALETYLEKLPILGS